jgi:hypothetical protein
MLSLPELAPQSLTGGLKKAKFQNWGELRFLSLVVSVFGFRWIEALQ